MNQPQIPSFWRSPDSPAIAPTVSRRLQHWLQQVWQRCLWTLAANSEPQVWQAIDRHGAAIDRQVYDPLSGQSQFFSSELEVRLWLEQQYSR